MIENYNSYNRLGFQNKDVIKEIMDVFGAVSLPSLAQYLKFYGKIKNVKPAIHNYEMATSAYEKPYLGTSCLVKSEIELVTPAKVAGFDAYVGLRDHTDGEQITEDLGVVKARFPYDYVYVNSAAAYLILNYDRYGEERILAHNYEKKFSDKPTVLCITASDGFADLALEDLPVKGEEDEAIIMRLKRNTARVSRDISYIIRGRKKK